MCVYTSDLGVGCEQVVGKVSAWRKGKRSCASYVQMYMLVYVRAYAHVCVCVSLSFG